MEIINFMLYSWHKFISSNRIVGVFLVLLAISVCIIAFFLSQKKQLIKGGISTASFAQSVVLIIYSAMVSVLLIIPITAYAMTKFQTVFYSYSTLWVIAPIIPVIAMLLTHAITLFLANSSKRRLILPAVLLTFTLVICGSIGGNIGNNNRNNKEFTIIAHQVSYDTCQPLLRRLEEFAASGSYGDSITILAPANVTTYAHMYSGNIHTLYGKDMWDPTMKPYTYNIYPDDYIKLYKWMSCAEVYGAIYNLNFETPVYSQDISFEEFEKEIEAGNALGGVAYTRLAKENNIDIIVIYTDGITLDSDSLSYVIDTMKLKTEYIPINDTESYILLFL